MHPNVVEWDIRQRFDACLQSGRQPGPVHRACAGRRPAKPVGRSTGCGDRLESDRTHGASSDSRVRWRDNVRGASTMDRLGSHRCEGWRTQRFGPVRPAGNGVLGRSTRPIHLHRELTHGAPLWSESDHSRVRSAGCRPTASSLRSRLSPEVSAVVLHRERLTTGRTRSPTPRDETRTSTPPATRSTARTATSARPLDRRGDQANQPGRLRREPW